MLNDLTALQPLPGQAKIESGRLRNAMVTVSDRESTRIESVQDPKPPWILDSGRSTVGSGEGFAREHVRSVATIEKLAKGSSWEVPATDAGNWAMNAWRNMASVQNLVAGGDRFQLREISQAQGHGAISLFYRAHPVGFHVTQGFPDAVWVIYHVIYYCYVAR